MATRTFSGDFRSLAPISKFVVNQAEAVGFSPSDVYAIQTAVDEACTNIIDHAYGGENIGEIEISVEEIKAGLRIILKDYGEPFDPVKVPQPDITSPLEIRKERGLGLYYIYQLMDKVVFEFSQSKGNTLTLVKYKGS